MVFLIVSANGDTEKVLELLEIHREQNAKLDTYISCLSITKNQAGQMNQLEELRGYVDHEPTLSDLSLPNSVTSWCRAQTKNDFIMESAL